MIWSIRKKIDSGRGFAFVAVSLISIYLISAQLYSSRLEYLPGNMTDFPGLPDGAQYIDIPLDENERVMFSGGSVTKRLYIINHTKFIMFRIDSGGNRKMLHNPRTCLMASGWHTCAETQSTDSALVFTGLDLKNHHTGRDAACLFWYELGENRHGSHVGFNFDYLIRKLTFSNSAAPQSLVLLQTFGHPDGGLPDLVSIAEMLQDSATDQSNKSS